MNAVQTLVVGSDYVHRVAAFLVGPTSAQTDFCFDMSPANSTCYMPKAPACYVAFQAVKMGLHTPLGL